jgi:hypothetical protein
MKPQAAPRGAQDGPGAPQAFAERIVPRAFAAGPIPYNYMFSAIIGSHGTTDGSPRLRGTVSLGPRLEGRALACEPGCVTGRSILRPT